MKQFLPLVLFLIVCAYINFDGTTNIADLMITIKIADYGISLSGHKKI